MARDFLAPLDPEEEIVLRRIAYGSVAIDKRIAERLVAQALVERASATLRLTPLGLMRFKALPRAPLLARRRSLQAVVGYVSAVIDKAQVQVRSQQPLNRGVDATPLPARSLPRERQPEDQDGEEYEQAGRQGRDDERNG